MYQASGMGQTHGTQLGHMGFPRGHPSSLMCTWDNRMGRTHGRGHVGWDTWESLGQSVESMYDSGTGRDGTGRTYGKGHVGFPCMEYALLSHIVLEELS